MRIHSFIHRGTPSFLGKLGRICFRSQLKTFFNLYKNEDKALSKVNQRFPTSAAEFKKRERKKAPSFGGLVETFS